MTGVEEVSVEGAARVPPPQVKIGVDVLFEARENWPDGARVALVTNRAALDGGGRSTLTRFLLEGEDVVAVLAPEHGYDLRFGPGEAFGRSVTSATGVEERPLYLHQQDLGSGLLRDVDVVVYDLPQVGCRAFTYLESLVVLLRHARETNCPLFVLDRPPVVPRTCSEGPLARESHFSSVAPVPMPHRYGLTTAEIARWVERREGPIPSMTTVSMAGFRRSLSAEACGIPWKRPSPNLHSPEGIAVYPGTVLLEGTNMSEGRGTSRPFLRFGAPWLEPGPLLSVLEARDIPGVSFTPVEFTPSASKYQDVLCRGLDIHLDQAELLQAFELGVVLLWEVHHLFGRTLQWTGRDHLGRPFLDRLAGSSDLRQCIEDGSDLSLYLAATREESARFDQSCRGLFLYPW